LAWSSLSLWASAWTMSDTANTVVLDLSTTWREQRFEAQSTGRSEGAVVVVVVAAQTESACRKGKCKRLVTNR